MNKTHLLQSGIRDLQIDLIRERTGIDWICAVKDNTIGIGISDQRVGSKDIYVVVYNSIGKQKRLEVACQPEPVTSVILIIGSSKIIEAIKLINDRCDFTCTINLVHSQLWRWFPG